MDPISTGLAALLLGATHLEARRLSLAGSIPRSRWLSAAGGISVAYVFLHLLPEIAALEGHLTEAIGGAGESATSTAESSAGGGDAGGEGQSESGTGGFLTALAYLVALAGLVVFYGLERLAHATRESSDDTADAGVFRLHMASFSLYNVLVGYLLVHEAESLLALVWFTLALALHFVVNDASLREHHAERYHATGRWILAVAVLAGWVVAHAVTLPEAAIGSVVAFLAGGILLNVIKEELPRERESSFPAFALSAAAYGGLLLLL